MDHPPAGDPVRHTRVPDPNEAVWVQIGEGAGFSYGKLQSVPEGGVESQYTWYCSFFNTFSFRWEWIPEGYRPPAPSTFVPLDCLELDDTRVKEHRVKRNALSGDPAKFKATTAASTSENPATSLKDPSRAAGPPEGVAATSKPAQSDKRPEGTSSSGRTVENTAEGLDGKHDGGEAQQASAPVALTKEHRERMEKWRNCGFEICNEVGRDIPWLLATTDLVLPVEHTLNNWQLWEARARYDPGDPPRAYRL
jgi:hypothetical protein